MTDQIRRWADRLLLFTIFLLPWQARYIIVAGQLNNGPYEYASISLYATDLLILGALLLSALAILLDKKITNNFNHKIYWLLIIGLLFFDCLSVFVASDRLLTLYCLARLFVGVALAWLIINSRLKLSKILAVLLLAISLQGAWAAWQFSQQAVPGNKWLGLASHYPSDSGVSAVTIEIAPPNTPPERWLRAYGSLDHPNMLGGLSALGLIIAFYLFINLYAQVYSRPKEIGLSLALLLTTSGLFFSFSRAAILAALFGLALLTLTQLKLWRRSLLASLIIFGLSVVLFMAYGQLYQNRLAPLAGEETVSLTERQNYVQQAQRLLVRHPWLGVGAGHYGLAIEQEIVKDQISYFYQPVHNVFLLIATELGLIGLLCWLALWGKLLLATLNQLKTNPDSQLTLAIWASAITIMLFDHWFWDLHFGVLLVWLVLGLMIKTVGANKKAQSM